MPPLGWGLFIFLLTSIPLQQQPDAFPSGTDKVVHLALYAVLAALTARGLASIAPLALRIIGTLVVIASTGAIDEWHQQFIPGRSADVFDWYADLSGGVAGTAFTLMTIRREPRS